MVSLQVGLLSRDSPLVIGGGGVSLIHEYGVGFVDDTLGFIAARAEHDLFITE